MIRFGMPTTPEIETSAEERFHLLGRRIGELTSQIVDTDRRIGALQAPGHVIHEGDILKRDLLEKHRVDLVRQRSELLGAWGALKLQLEAKNDS
jgi:hypothetical protein